MYIIHNLLRLCFFKGTPASLPYAPVLLTLIVFIHLGLNVMNRAAPEVSWAKHTVATLISYILLIGAIYLILNFRKLLVRFHKTLMAYLGTELIFMILALGIAILGEALFKNGAPLFFLFLFFWILAIKSRILKLCFDVQTPVAVLMAINLELIRALPQIILYMPILTEQGGMA